MLTITLTPELEAVIADKAKQQGTTPENLTLDSLRNLFLPGVPELPSAPQTLEEKVAAIVAGVPEEEWNKLPADMGEHLDHYIYGIPKRP